MKRPRELLFERHNSAQPDLDKVRHYVVSENFKKTITMPEPTSLMQRLWIELFLRARGTWAGIATAWLIILFLHSATSETNTSMAKQTSPDKTQIETALREQRRILAELNEDNTIADKPKTVVPRPRSETGSLIRFA